MNRGNKETQKWKTTVRKMNRNGDFKMVEQSLVCGQTNQQGSLKQKCVCVCVCVCVCMHVQVEECARHLVFTFKCLPTFTAVCVH